MALVAMSLAKRSTVSFAKTFSGSRTKSSTALLLSLMLIIQRGTVKRANRNASPSAFALGLSIMSATNCIFRPARRPTRAGRFC